MPMATTSATTASIRPDPIARDREAFSAWVDTYIRGTEDFAEFQRKLAQQQEAN